MNARWLSLTGLVIAIGLAQAYAQALPTSLQATVLSMPTGMTGEPMAINAKGEVGGWAAKSAGSVLRIGSSDGSPVPSTFFYWEPMSYIYPQVWINGRPTTVARHGGNYNTAIVGGGPAGGWSALSTGSAAKVRTSDWVSDPLVNWPSSVKVNLGLIGSTYSPLGRAVWRLSQAPLVNQRGTVAGAAAEWPHVVQIEVGGRVVLPAMPAGLSQWRVVGLSEDDHVLIEANLNDVVEDTATGSRFTQRAWQRRCYVWHRDVLTEVRAPSPQAVVSVNCGGISAGGLVAAYVAHNDGGALDEANLFRSMFTWRDGQFVRYQTSFMPERSAHASAVQLLDSGVGYFYPSSQNLSTEANDLWVFSQGVHQRVAPLVRPALASGAKVWLRSLSAAGPLLVEVRTGSWSTRKFQVLVPK